MTIKEQLEYMEEYGVHPSILELLGEWPELLRGPSGKNKIPGKTYPNMRAWINYHEALTHGDSWGDEARMTRLAKFCLGNTVAIIFPKYFTSEWPRTKAYQLARRGSFILPKNQLKPFLTPRQELGLE